MFRAHAAAGGPFARKPHTHESSYCSGARATDCVLLCLASAALSGILTCGAFRFIRRQSRCCRKTTLTKATQVEWTKAPQAEWIDSEVAVTATKRQSLQEARLPRTAECQQEDCRQAAEEHLAICNKLEHTENALQEALQAKVILEEQAKLTQQALADHQERLAMLASGLQEQQQQQYVQSKRNAAVVADLQTKLEQADACSLQMQGQLAHERDLVKCLREQLQAVEPEAYAAKRRLKEALLHISSLRSAKQHSDSQHDSHIKDLSCRLEAATQGKQTVEDELLRLRHKAADVACKLETTGSAIVLLNQKLSRSQQEKGQLERALTLQARQRASVEAELAIANARTRQLEMDLHVAKECLARGPGRRALAENVHRHSRKEVLKTAFSDGLHNVL